MAAASDVHDSFSKCRDHKGRRTRTGASFHRGPGRFPSPSGEAQPTGPGKLQGLSKEITVVLIWVLVALLLLFAIVGGIAITKFLFFVLIVAALLALIGFFARGTA
jgi:hypothetical protein